MAGTDPANRKEHAFIVRVWHEKSGDTGAWRGSVVHVATRRHYDFADLSELLEFIRKSTPAT